MRIELKPYQVCSLTGDELCVAGAFLELPCLYGVPGEWIKRARGGLRSRIVSITSDLERRRILLPEPGGAVRMEERLYEILDTMGRADLICRICFGAGSSRSRIYLYRKEGSLAYMEPDGRGRCLLGQLPSADVLKTSLSECPKAAGNAASGAAGQRAPSLSECPKAAGNAASGAAAGQRALSPGFSVPQGEWLGALVFEAREERFFERIYDCAWEQETAREELSVCWERLCKILEQGREERGR